MVKKFTEQNFKEEVLGAKGLVLVDFYADWCGPCKMMAPIVEEISNERADIVVGKMNIDENMQIAYNYKIVSIPTLIVFKDGEEHKRIVGYVSKNELVSELA